MAFGIDDFIIAVLTAAASSAASSAFAPDAPTNTIGGQLPGARQQAGGAGEFEQFIPQTSGPQETVADAGVPGIDLGAQSAVIDQAAQILAAQGPPPVVPLEPAQPVGPPISRAGSGPVGPPVSRQGAATPPAAPQKSIGEILAASPEALAAVANLLGLNQQQGDGGTRPAPVAGGGLGSVVPGFQLPQAPAIGQLLAQIPRLR